jgi:hypothetical protein
MNENIGPAPDVANEPITLEQIRGKALAIRDEVKDEVSEQVRERRNQLVAAGVVAIVVFVGVAYFVGSRAGRRASGPRLFYGRLVELDRVRDVEGAVCARVVFAPGEPLRTSEVAGLAAAAVAALPGLRGHRCDNGAGLTFADELTDTELAHLIEHAALELMAMTGSSPLLRGETSWDFGVDGRGVFLVRIECEDAPLAIGALESATALVRALTHGEVAPNMEAEARRLRATRGR